MPPEISVKDMKETLQAELGAMFGEELRRPTRRDTAVVSVRLPENALQHLRDIS